MAIPTANNNSSTSHGNGTITANSNIINGGRSAVPENSAVGPSERALKHHISLSVDWTRDEQSLLEELLTKYASDSKKKENGKRRKDDSNSSKMHKDKKEKVADQQVKPSSHGINHANGFPYAKLPTFEDSDDDISYEDIDGALGQLIEQNTRAMKQISANFSAFKENKYTFIKVLENINLFSQIRNNIVALLNESLNDMPEIMKQMPPLNVKLDDQLINFIIPQPAMPMKF